MSLRINFFLALVVALTIGSIAQGVSVRPVKGRKGSSGVTVRRDDPNEPYNTQGALPTGGPITNGGLQAKPLLTETIPSGEDCICVPYYLCENSEIVTYGEGVFDPRRILIKPPPEQEIDIDNTDGDDRCPGLDQVCCREPSTTEVRPFNARCGIRNDNGINRRVLNRENGGEAQFGEWAWQAAILRVEPSGDFLFECGGTLIGERHILTVAHCVQNFIAPGSPGLVVRLGEWDTSSIVEFLPHEDYRISNITMHPRFRNATLFHDIAILTTDRPITFHPHISPVCLPANGEGFEGHDCVVTGWGKTELRANSYSNIMKEVSLPIIDNLTCQSQLRGTRLGDRFRLHDSFICAGAREGEDACKGDGGGPLSCFRRDGLYVLAGLVSWGIDCGGTSPGVYVRVGLYLDWIASVTQQPISTFQATTN